MVYSYSPPPPMQHGYLEMAEKGELVCDGSISPSPAITPRQSMTEVESSINTSNDHKDPSTTVPTTTNTEDCEEEEQAETFTKGSDYCCKHL